MQHPIDVTELERLGGKVNLPAGEPPIDLNPSQTGNFERAREVFEANTSLKADSSCMRSLFEQAPSPIVVLSGRILTMGRFLSQPDQECQAPAAARPLLAHGFGAGQAPAFQIRLRSS